MSEALGLLGQAGRPGKGFRGYEYNNKSFQGWEWSSQISESAERPNSLYNAVHRGGKY